MASRSIIKEHLRENYFIILWLCRRGIADVLLISKSALSNWSVVFK